MTEDDVTDHLARRHERQQSLDVTQPTQLPADLQHRLDRLRAIAVVSTAAPPIDEQTIQALEAAMFAPACPR